MKKFIAPMLALAMTATSALAGGPVVVEEEAQPEVVAEAPRSGWWGPVIIGLVLVCAIACDSNDDDTPPAPAP
jgi:hypothetical protein